MLNYSGSSLISDIFKIMDEYKVFDLLGIRQSCAMMFRIMEHGSNEYDCFPSEMIDESLADKLGICTYCRHLADNVQEGLCPTCYEGENAV